MLWNFCFVWLFHFNWQRQNLFDYKLGKQEEEWSRQNHPLTSTEIYFVSESVSCLVHLFNSPSHSFILSAVWFAYKFHILCSTMLSFSAFGKSLVTFVKRIFLNVYNPEMEGWHLGFVEDLIRDCFFVNNFLWQVESSYVAYVINPILLTHT